jgi:DNA-binding transcriptional MerR regulator
MALKMKELEARTGVNREAIRFYIREGLLPEPEKPKRNVALYTEEHVTLTRLIKELQDKHFLPLKTVKAVLDSPHARSMAENERATGMSHFLPALLRDTTPGPDRTVAEVSASSGLSGDQIESLDEIGAVCISADGLIDFRDAAILETWGQAQSRGFDAKHDYTPRFFIKYVDAARQLAKLEVAQFLQNFGSSLDGRAAGEMAAEGIEFANTLISLLHTKFIVEEINAQTSNPVDTAPAE